MVNRKAGFGFELLIILIGLLVFFQVFMFSGKGFLGEHELLVKYNENNYLLNNLLEYNGSFIGLQAWFCNGSVEGLEAFNNSAHHFLSSYSGKEYLLHASTDSGDFFVSSTGETSVCLEQARIASYSDTCYCGKIINIEFSLYSIGELSEC